MKELTLENKIIRYENKLFNIIDKYEKGINNTNLFLRNQIFKLIFIHEKLFFAFIELLKLTGLVMRYSTFPLHWIWINLELKKKEGDITDLPIFQMGAHYFWGKPKAGKSTVVYHAMMDYAYYSGKCSYTTEYMELPRQNVYGHDYYYHQVFDPSDFYVEGKQVAGFNTNLFNIIVYEEMLAKYQQRLNKTKVYNDEVLPMITSIGTQRHQGIDLFYFISQLPRNDIALMQLLVGYHEPRIRKAFDYKYWLNTGKFRFYIKGWWIKSSKLELTSGYDYKVVQTRKWWYKNKYREDFDYFNRLNMKMEFDKLPKFKGREMKA